MVNKIISGAQTGADRAGLDAALHLGIEPGGWIPKGRRTDEGPLSIEDFIKYKLREHGSAAYPPRTKSNVLESDGTVLFGNMTSPGCVLTINLCRAYNKPFKENPSPEILWYWLNERHIKTLNVAGNRERTNPGIYKVTFDTLVSAINRRG